MIQFDENNEGGKEVIIKAAKNGRM